MLNTYVLLLLLPSGLCLAACWKELGLGDERDEEA